MTISNRLNAEAIYIVDACRTPTGRIGGQLAHVRLDDLAAHAIRSLLRRQPAVPGSAIANVVRGRPTKRVRTTATSDAWRLSSPAFR